jgi:hypothetical protein
MISPDRTTVVEANGNGCATIEAMSWRSESTEFSARLQAHYKGLINKSSRNLRGQARAAAMTRIRNAATASVQTTFTARSVSMFFSRGPRNVQSVSGGPIFYSQNIVLEEWNSIVERNGSMLP